ncbi:MAG TPA: TIGR01777 family oxidoreductase [Vicinamibacterales bacterium]|nr:TIGR01777 family oxidoreductase [Vicinamibacterales bacterium]
MKIIIAGGTGFLGRPLTTALADDGHELVILTREPRDSGGARVVRWNPNGEIGAWASEIDGAGAVVNLAGEPIAGKRWTAAQKQRILDSRVDATRSLTAAIRAAAAPPPVFVSGSAVGYYGPLGDEIATEATPAGSDFLARVCLQWEQEAMRATSDRTRVACIRTGIVLERDGGALPQMLPPFWFGAGGPVGSGRQYWPWIHRDDWIALVRWAIATPAATGAINATAPHPVTNKTFADALGRAMHRPAFMPAPGFALRLLLGEMADALLLSGQNAVPAKAERAGFAFRYARVDEALGAIFSRA